MFIGELGQELKGWNLSVTVFLVLLYCIKGWWCDIIVVNVHSPPEDKDDDIEDNYYEEIERFFDQLPVHHMKIL